MPLARDLGLVDSKEVTGPSNSITDVPGVMVGHQTIRNGDLNTGVTAILPHDGNLFQNKVSAAVEVINGFGKSAGLMQVAELGTIETPLLLTNTLSIAPCVSALIKSAIRENPGIGRTTSTVNPVVLECNDGWLSDIQALGVTEADAEAALQNACDMTVVQGSVGAGTGMRCFGFKGGIGTSSRLIYMENKPHYLGVLVLSNFGRNGDLVLPDGRRPKATGSRNVERGSIIMVTATDVALDHRQLHRVTKRCGAGIARLGSFWGDGSGDVAIGFTTANKVLHEETRDLVPMHRLNQNKIDLLFKAACDATVEAVLNSMLSSPGMTGRAGNYAPSLADALRK